MITAKEDHLSAKIHAEHAALRYMDNNPPELELGVISMNQETFQRCSLANMHIAGQATMHGVVMSGENLEDRTNYQDNYRPTGRKQAGESAGLRHPATT